MLALAAIAASPGICLALAPCPAAARVGGEEQLAGTIRSILANRGIATLAPSACPATLATVRWTSGGIETTVRDGSGRSRTQVVSDAPTAATVIESWTRTDLLSALLEARRSPTVASRPDDERPPHPPPPAAPPGTSSFAVTTGVGRGDDASLWLDGTLAGCFLVGAGVCAGALLRTLADLEQGGATDRIPGARAGVDVLVTADVPTRLAGLHLVPGVGFGAGWLRTRADHGPSGGPGDDENLGGLRLEAHTACRFRVAAGISLDALLAANVSPLAHRGDVTDFQEGVTMAGEPLWTVRVGMGVRFGDPGLGDR